MKNPSIGLASTCEPLKTDFLKSALNHETGFSGAVGKPQMGVQSQSGVAQFKIVILLCTYFGQRYLAEQLDSFAAQTHTNWELWVSDDGSEDGTHAVLESFQQKWPSGRLSIHFGPGEGFAANFLSLTCRANIDADYYAYADQDDIWEADKLARAVEWLRTIPPDVPALYCSRTRLVDSENRNIGLSPLFSKPPNFRNALVQNIGGGNTMVFNNASRRLLRQAGEKTVVVSHDWWAYMLVTGCGGQVFYDENPTVRYRQHCGNLVGTNVTWFAIYHRIRIIWRGRFKAWCEVNISALRKLSHHLTPENRKTLETFAQAREMSLFARLIGLKRSGIYRQSMLGNLGLAVAAVFKML